MNVLFPYQYNGRGKTRQADADRFIQGLIEQVLFTSPGERVMRPDFGSGLNQLLFEPNSSEMAATTQALVQGALQQWLGHLITVEAVDIQVQESTLQVAVSYIVRRTEQREHAVFASGGGQ